MDVSTDDRKARRLSDARLITNHNVFEMFHHQPVQENPQIRPMNESPTGGR